MKSEKWPRIMGVIDSVNSDLGSNGPKEKHNNHLGHKGNLQSVDAMTASTEELLKAVNELKVEIQRIREVVDILLNVVIEGEIEEDPRWELQLDHLRAIDPFSANN